MWARLGSIGLMLVVLMFAQSVGMGPDQSAGVGVSVVKFVDWNSTPPVGCTPGTGGYCMGNNGFGGDTFYGQAWMPNASGLPITTGLPIVGTLNDNSTTCGNNISVYQLDTFNWSTVAGTHMQTVNCMNDYGGSGGNNSPAGWNGHCTGLDNTTSTGWVCSWKNGSMFSKGGILYMMTHRQITTGQPSVHDATIVMSPDSGAHWCNPYTFFQVGTSGVCNSPKWSATGDAPLCASASNTTPCTDTGYLNVTHSSMMWNANTGNNMPFNSFGYQWINYGNQDGASYPTGINDGCDPSVYTCFVAAADGSVARVVNTTIMDISTWQYYTCSAITPSYRCPGNVASSWTGTFANRTPVMYANYYTGGFNATDVINVYSILYVKELKCYLMSTIMGLSPFNVIFMTAPAPYGPWTMINKSPLSTLPDAGFISFMPSTYYNVVSPSHIQLGMEADSYRPGNSTATPQFSVWDFVGGRSTFGGTNVSYAGRATYSSNAGYQFSLGNVTHSFPRSGLVWSFDFLDMGANSGIQNWPYWLDSGNKSALVVACDGTWVSNANNGYNAPTQCGLALNPPSYPHGQGMNNFGIQSIDTNENYGGNFRVYPYEQPFPSSYNSTGLGLNNVALQGNSSYSVVTVLRQEALTPFSRPGCIWSTGVSSSSDNTQVELCTVNAALQLNWNASYRPHYQVLSSFSFANFTNWYFIATTVGAATGGNCATVHIWVGQSGTLADQSNPCTNTPSYNAATRTPNVSAGPLVLGVGGAGDMFTGTNATTIEYNRVLSQFEVENMYNSMKLAAKGRGITIQ